MSTTTPVHLGPDAALVYLDIGIKPLIRPEEAHDIADAFRECAYHLEGVQRREAERQDREAGRAVNRAFRVVNRAAPGTVSTASTRLLTPVLPEDFAGGAA